MTATQTPTAMQLDRLRMLSETHLGDPERFLKEAGKPYSRADAGDMLAAFHCHKTDTKPLPGSQTEYLALIRQLAAVKDHKPVTSKRAQEERTVPTADPDATTKACSKCGEEKPLDEFYNQKSTRDGKTYQCKGCMRAKGKKTTKKASSKPARKQAPSKQTPVIEVTASVVNGWEPFTDPRLSHLRTLKELLTDLLDFEGDDLTLDDAANVALAIGKTFAPEAGRVSG